MQKRTTTRNMLRLTKSTHALTFYRCMAILGWPYKRGQMHVHPWMAIPGSTHGFISWVCIFGWPSRALPSMDGCPWIAFVSNDS